MFSIKQQKTRSLFSSHPFFAIPQSVTVSPFSATGCSGKASQRALFIISRSARRLVISDPGPRSVQSTMVIDSISSPHRRSQSSSSQPSPFKKFSGRDELGSWSVLLQRHRFLLTTLVVLAFLCTVYLYFAVTLGGNEFCSGLSGSEKARCQAKSSMIHGGKLKFM